MRSRARIRHVPGDCVHPISDSKAFDVHPPSPYLDQTVVSLLGVFPLPMCLKIFDRLVDEIGDIIGFYLRARPQPPGEVRHEGVVDFHPTRV